MREQDEEPDLKWAFVGKRTLSQNPTNSPVMRGFENQVRRAVEQRQAVDIVVVPVYRGDHLVPIGVTMNAQGSNGFELFVTILNGAG